MPVYYVIPNTAISIGESMTFIAHSNAEESELAEVVSLFGKMGRVMQMCIRDRIHRENFASRIG